MILSLVRIFLLLFASYVPALPWGNGSNTCSSKIPSLMIPIKSNAPTSVFSNTSTFLVSRDPSQGIQWDCLLRFEIPRSSRECQLELDFPSRYPYVNQSTKTVVFWAVPNILSTGCCWDDAPSKYDRIGSTPWPINGSRLVVTKLACQEVLSFRADLSGEDGAESISFSQLTSEGLMLRYNC